MLRNIYYLRFGSKIQQGFAAATPSLTPPLSPLPLWMSWEANEEGGGSSAFYIEGGLPPPCRAAAWPTAPPPGGGLPQEPKCDLK